jgi:hypothetical protein
LGAEVVPAIVLSPFVWVGNPLIVMATMGFMGYQRRTAFMAGLTVRGHCFGEAQTGRGIR